LAEEEKQPQQREGEGREGNEEPNQREQHGGTRRRNERQESDMEKMYATLEQSICQRSDQESLLQDEDRLFLLFLHKNLSSIQPDLKLLAKTEILQVLSKYNNSNVNAPVQFQSYSQPSSQYYVHSNIPPFSSTNVGESSHFNPCPQFRITTQDENCPRQNTPTFIRSCHSDISGVVSMT
jgi:septum formation topological specificity factor MinE